MSNDDIPFFMVERKIDLCDALLSSIDAIRVEFGSIISLITNDNSFAVDSGQLRNWMHIVHLKDERSQRDIEYKHVVLVLDIEFKEFG